QNTFFAAGTHRVFWDGYDEGEPTNVVDGAYDILRSRVSPGTYHAKLLYHRGISLNYEFSVQSPGTPAWHTSDRTGAWLSDNGAPADDLFLPTYKGGTMLICSDPAETGHGVMYLDLTGRKIQGMDHISNNLNYPVALARDAGPQADSAYLAWAAMVRQAKLKVLYFQTSNGRPGSTQYATGLAATTIYGIAAYNNRLVVSYDGKLTFINGTNAKSGNYTITNTVTLDNARGVTTDGTYLYILVGSQLRRYSVNWLAGTISGATTLASGLSDPKRVRLANNLLYVSDHGSSHQVKVYNLSGTLTRTIGQAGGPQEGVYNEQRMAEPLGVDVDSSGKLWVAEGHYMPKRIS